MSTLPQHNQPKRSARMAVVAAWKKYQKYIPVLKELLFAGTQAIGGAALALYTSENSSSRLLPSVYAVISLGGTYNVLRSMRKMVQKTASNDRHKTCSVYHVASGSFIYFGSLDAFSETWRSNYKLWMPFLGSAALGLIYTASSTNSTKTVSTMKPLSKCCHLLFEPALILGGVAYLKYFRNHDEEWVYGLSLVATGVSGFIFGIRGSNIGEDVKQPKTLVLKAIAVLMGGSILTVSSTILALYVSAKEVHSWRSYALATNFFNVSVIFVAIGLFLIYGSITCFQRYACMHWAVANCIDRMLIVLASIYLAWLLIKSKKYKIIVYPTFPFLAVQAFAVFKRAAIDLYIIIPRTVFIKYCQRVFGPLLTVGSSAATAYIVYHFGLDSGYFKLMVPYVLAGIYVTYKGFKKIGFYRVKRL